MQIRNPVKSGLYKVAVTGLLVGPTNQPLVNTNIRITSKENSSIPQGITMIAKVDANGLYSFYLVAGTYSVELLIKREFKSIGTIEITNTTKSPQDLMNLIDEWNQKQEDEDTASELMKARELVDQLVTESLTGKLNIDRITERDIDAMF